MGLLQCSCSNDRVEEDIMGHFSAGCGRFWQMKIQKHTQIQHFTVSQVSMDSGNGPFRLSESVYVGGGMVGFHSHRSTASAPATVSSKLTERLDLTDG